MEDDKVNLSTWGGGKTTTTNKEKHINKKCKKKKTRISHFGMPACRTKSTETLFSCSVKVQLDRF